MDIVTVGSINYIAAAFCAVPGCVCSEFSPLAIHAIWTGATMGVCYFIAFFFLIFAVRWIGASNSAAVSRVSLVIPVCAGIGLWGEVPDFFQVLGIVTAFASLFLIGRSRTDPNPEIPGNTNENPAAQRWVLWVLGAFFLVCGTARLAQQACQQLCEGATDYPAFLLAAFCFAAVPSFAVLLWRYRGISRGELWVGVILGLTNILQSHYILRSLDLYDGFLVFTVTNTGGLIFTTGIAVFGFKERINRQSLVGIGLASLSIIFLQAPLGRFVFGNS